MALTRRSAFALMSVLLPWQAGQGQTADPSPLRYSVLVASLTSLEDARGLQQRWATPETPYYVVPLRVNRQVYFRVMAGILPARGEAVALMNDLVARGVKDSAGEWHVRDTELAFELGIYVSEAESRSAVARALGEGIPAYTIVAASAGGLRYRVFAGGFENEAEAEYLRGFLAARGTRGSLIPRIGVLPLGEDVAVAAEAPPPPPPPEPDAVVSVETPPIADSVPAQLQPRAGQAEAVVEEVPPPVRDRTEEAARDTAARRPGQEGNGGVLSGTLPQRPLPQMPSQGTNTGFSLGLAAVGGASPGVESVHGYGGVLLHPHVGKVGLLLSGMLGRGAGYDSMAGFGAISYLLGEAGNGGLWALGGFGYYEETGALDENRSLALPAAGAMITFNLGAAQLIGAYTAMFGTFEEPGLSVDLRVYRGSVGVGWLVGGDGGMGS